MKFINSIQFAQRAELWFYFYNEILAPKEESLIHIDTLSIHQHMKLIFVHGLD